MKTMEHNSTTGKPNHHLWNNNGTWFVHYTTYPTPVTKERVRKSLKTRNLEEARLRRDQLLGLHPGCGGSGQHEEIQVLVAEVRGIRE